LASNPSIAVASALTSDTTVPVPTLPSEMPCCASTPAMLATAISSPAAVVFGCFHPFAKKFMVSRLLRVAASSMAAARQTRLPKRLKEQAGSQTAGGRAWPIARRVVFAVFLVAFKLRQFEVNSLQTAAPRQLIKNQRVAVIRRIAAA
jgi:hypothetical protein